VKLIARISFLLVDVLFLSINALFADGKIQSNASTLYYVSPSGNDNNHGTIDQPFATIQKARDVIRTLIPSMSSDIYVYLRAGVYYQSQTLIFDERDAGANSYNIIYRNYSGEVPIISGGKVLGGWTLYDTLNTIWRAPIGDLQFRQLYVNDSAATRAKTQDASSSWLSSVSNQSDIEVVKRIAGGWANDFLRITPAKNSYVVKEPENSFYNNLPWYLQGTDLFFENDRAFIKSGGEWASNNNEGFVYYKPRTGEIFSAAVVIAPVCDPLIIIRGSSTNNPAHHIQFFGITFAHSTWILPNSAGFLQVQANQYYSGGRSIDFNPARPSAGIWIENAHDIRIERCIIKDMGASAVDTYKGAYNICIVGNVVKDIGGNGICDCVAGIPESLSTVWGDSLFNPVDIRDNCTNDTIANNFISKCGASYPGAVAVFCGYSNGIVIEHNEITDLDYTGINLGWGWADGDNAMHDNLIKANLVYNVMKALFDGGGIYTLSKQLGTNIVDNYVFNVIQGNGIYNDQGSGGDSLPFVVQCNVIGNVGLKKYNTNLIGKVEFIACSLSDSIITNNAGLEPTYIDIKNQRPPVDQEVHQPRACIKILSPHVVFIQKPKKIIIILPVQNCRLHRIKIVDLKGRTIRILADSGYQPVTQALSWDYNDYGGRRVAKGLYIVQADVDGQIQSTLLNVHM
jgi:hypothetical protein